MRDISPVSPISCKDSSLSSSVVLGEVVVVVVVVENSLRRFATRNGRLVTDDDNCTVDDWVVEAIRKYFLCIIFSLTCDRNNYIHSKYNYLIYNFIMYHAKMNGAKGYNINDILLIYHKPIMILLFCLSF